MCKVPRADARITIPYMYIICRLDDTHCHCKHNVYTRHTTLILKNIYITTTMRIIITHSTKKKFILRYQAKIKEMHARFKILQSLAL